MKILMTVLALLGSTFLTIAHGAGVFKEPLNPNEFFEGQQLIIAQGIAKNDLKNGCAPRVCM